MSRLFILFLIALLPLRGWAVQRMVLDVGAPLVAASQAQEAAMAKDCALHMQMAAQAHTSQEKQGGPHAGCQSCDMCMPMAALDDVVGLAFVPVARVLTIPQPETFASADPARCAKPPIS